MTEYLLPDEMSFEAAGAALAGLAVEDADGADCDRTFYDTFDGLLHDEGMSLHWEGGRARLIEHSSGRELAAAAAPQPTGPLFARQLPPGRLRDALGPLIGVRALLALAHVHSRVKALRVLDEERKTVVRIALEQPVLVTGRGDAPLRPRLSVSALRGYGGELRAVARRLQGDFGFRPVDQPLVDEAVRAAGGAPGGTPSRIDVPLGYNQRADEAVVAVLRRLWQVIVANCEGTIADLDPEFLHDLRVSVRRTRAVQREMRRVFPASELAHFRAEFRWLQLVTGDSRDLDVYVLEFDAYRALLREDMRTDLDPLLDVLSDRRRAAHREMERALRSDRMTTLGREWAAFLHELPARTADDPPEAARAIGAVSAERIRRVYRRMVKMGRPIGPQSPAEDFHELRKKGKELRYLLELFAAPVYPAEVVRPMVKALKGLQDVLGRHQDREVQMATLRSLRDDVAARPEGLAAVMAMGALVDRLGEDERAARREFAERFDAFASRSQRALVRETFS